MRPALRAFPLQPAALLLLAALAAPLPASAPQAPLFSLNDAAGVEWTRSAADAKPLLIDFWASWCGPCLAAMPDLNRFYLKHQARLGVLGANVDPQGWPVIKPLVRRFDVKYPVVAASEELAKSFGCSGYPCLVVLEKGRIVKKLSGRKKLKQLEQELKPWL